MWDIFVFSKNARSKQSPNGRKFAQSGDPVAERPIKKWQVPNIWQSPSKTNCSFSCPAEPHFAVETLKRN
jgi:hypothetical protein